MGLDVVLYGEEGLALCEPVHAASEAPLVYATVAYIRFVLRAVPRTRLRLLVALDAAAAVGYLPLVEQSAPGRWRVLNSLPFFGSHGGPVVRRGPGAAAVRGALLARAMELARAEGAASITLIENPLAPLDAAEMAAHGLSPVDDRIGQFTPLPPPQADPYAALMGIFHLKTRNAVRKGERLGQRFERRTDAQALQWLQQTHARSIEAMGGVSKSREVFEALLQALPLEKDARLYIGSLAGEPVSGLLLLLAGETVEYFTPVVAEAYKDEQALSALIVHAMAEAVADGYARWNWGGTWRTQEGVYRFKSRFGATDHPYRYFHAMLDPALQSLPGAEARQAFPYFYTHRYTS